MRRFMLILGCLAIVALAGCNDDETTIVEPGELAPPLGLYSITGDGEARLYWFTSNYEDDLLGYKIFVAEGTYEGGSLEAIPTAFALAGSLTVTPPSNDLEWIDVVGLTNGTTYSFLVCAAKDDWTDLSYTSNIVEDTPRPETATAVRLYAKQEDATQAGLELTGFSLIDCTDLVNYTTGSGQGDVMCERFDPGAGQRAWIDGINGGQVQDIGYLADWLDADEAPPQGYAETGHSVEALMGHVYAIKTGDNHYAKVQVLDLDADGDWIEVKAAFQTQAGQPEYK